MARMKEWQNERMKEWQESKHERRTERNDRKARKECNSCRPCSDCKECNDCKSAPPYAAIAGLQCYPMIDWGGARGTPPLSAFKILKAQTG